MKHWIIPSNHKFYDYDRSFADYGFVDWNQKRFKYSVGDIVYIYEIKPFQKLGYITVVEKVKLNINQIRDDRKYWCDPTKYYPDDSDVKFVRLRLLRKIDTYNITFEDMIKHGLTCKIRTHITICPELLEYIENRLR